MTIEQISNILLKAKPGQKLALRCENNSTDVNGSVVQLESQDGKVKSTDMDGWYETWPDKPKLRILATNGNICEFDYADVPQPLAYSSGAVNISKKVLKPFFLCSDINTYNKIASVDDVGGQILNLSAESFACCNKLSSINFPKVMTIGNHCFCGADGTSTYAERYWFPPNIISCDLPNVEYIGDYAFGGCPLTSINCPKVKYIGEYAFKLCDNLQKITIDNEVLHVIDNGYGDGNNLVVTDDETSCLLALNKTTRIINSEITSIGKACCFQNWNLSSVDLPNVTTIEDNAFDKCQNIKYINIPNVTTIGEDAFFHCSSITSIDTNDLTSIGKYAFQYCRSLSSINVSNVVEFQSQSFHSCSSLMSVDLNNALSIYGAAFAYCHSLYPIINAKNVRFIQNYAFGDTPLSSLYVDNDILHSISDGHGHENQVIVNADESECVYMVPRIPGSFSNETITSFNEYGCKETYISDISAPNAVNIGKYAFDSNHNLTSVWFEHDGLSIGRFAFRYSENLSSINIPRVSSIADYAFNSCSKLSFIDMSQITQVPTLEGTSVFYNTPNGISCYVPEALLPDFSTAINWSTLSANGKLNFIGV